MRRLVPELDNARAALDWASGEAGDIGYAVALAGASASLFMNLGLSHEALGRMSGLQARIDDSVHPQRAALFWLRLSEMGGSGRLPPALTLEAANRAQCIYRNSGTPRRLYRALLRTAWCLNQAGEADAAESMLPELLSLEEPAWPVWLRCDRLNLQGVICQMQQRFEEALAVDLQQQALLLREPGEKRGLMRCENALCNDLNMLRRYEETVLLVRSVVARERGAHSGNMVYLWMRLLHAQIFLGRIGDADATVRQAMLGWRRDGAVLLASGLLATVLAERSRWGDAARVGAAANAYQRRGNLERNDGYRGFNQTGINEIIRKTDPRFLATNVD